MTGPADLLRRAVVRTARIVVCAAYVGYQFLVSNLLVLQEIVRPRPRATPAIVALPLPGRTELEAVSLANLITLTPGTLTVEMFHDPPTLYIHGMFVDDPDAFRQQLLTLETRLRAAMRPVRRHDRDMSAGETGGDA